MTDDDNIADDDLQLKQMRSVWLSMRDDDEEPSDRGMASLMAAAREQADSNRRRDENNPSASWWSRLLEQLRRPPVLALATVVVLIGGAIAINQKKDRGELPEIESERAYEPSITTGSPAPTPTPTMNDGVGGEDLSAAGSAAAPGTVAPPPPVVTERPRTEWQQRTGPKKDGAKKEAPKKPEKAESAPPPAGNTKFSATPDSAEAPMELATGDEGGDMQSKGAAESTSIAPQAQPAPEKKPVSRSPLPSIEGEDRSARDLTVAQLVKQCEAAAAKSDCAAVRTIAAKIAKQDPATYRNRVAKNANVARCLEPAPPIEASPAPAD